MIEGISAVTLATHEMSRAVRFYRAPVAAKPSAMPPNERLRPNDLEDPKIDGNQRYSWTKNRRSLLVSRALPRHVRPSRISCWRRTAFSASSRALI